MTTVTLLGFILLPITLLIAAVAINQFRLWDILANFTLPWFCSALAVSLLILGAVCLVMQASPSSLPPRIRVFTVAGTLVTFGVGMVVDARAYHPKPHDWYASLGGWLGFAIILSAVFTLASL